jgi:flagellar basal body-associated protein FliL
MISSSSASADGPQSISVRAMMVVPSSGGNAPNDQGRERSPYRNDDSSEAMSTTTMEEMVRFGNSYAPARRRRPSSAGPSSRSPLNGSASFAQQNFIRQNFAHEENRTQVDQTNVQFLQNNLHLHSGLDPQQVALHAQTVELQAQSQVNEIRTEAVIAVQQASEYVAQEANTAVPGSS